MGELLRLLEALDRLGISYRLDCQRDALMVIVPSPSRYFEIEYFEDGHVEIQEFGPSSLVEETNTDAVISVLRAAVNGV